MAKQHVLIGTRVYTLKPGVDADAFVAVLVAKGKKAMKCKAPPSLRTMEKWASEGRGAKAVDGCTVGEIDGVCKHGCECWMRVLGMV